MKGSGNGWRSTEHEKQYKKSLKINDLQDYKYIRF
jgi:hypothetical protein